MNLASLQAALLGLFLPILLGIGLLGLIVIGITRATVRPGTRGSAPFLLAFGSLGGVAGLVAGVSRESVVGALLTGLLGIISGLLSYMFGKESLKEWRAYIPYAIMLLVVSSLAGLSLGGIYRRDHDIYEQNLKKEMLEYEKVYLEVMKEQRLRRLPGSPGSATSAGPPQPGANTPAR